MIEATRSIETQVGHRILVPAMLREFVREQRYCAEFTKLGSDVWVTWEPVAPHTDSTEDGLCTYGLILANDPQVRFVHGGKRWGIPPGTLYKMDGRVEHSTEGACGLFAALIWDMPPAWNLADFANELARDGRFR